MLEALPPSHLYRSWFGSYGHGARCLEISRSVITGLALLHSSPVHWLKVLPAAAGLSLLEISLEFRIICMTIFSM